MFSEILVSKKLCFCLSASIQVVAKQTAAATTTKSHTKTKFHHGKEKVSFLFFKKEVEVDDVATIFMFLCCAS